MSATTSATNPSYVQRALDVTVTLGEGTFGQTGKNTLTLSGLRVVATIQKGGFPNMDTAEIRVFGVPQSLMNQVSTLGIPQTMARWNNIVTLTAGDAVNGMAQVFSGSIYSVVQKFNAAPETYFQIVSFAGYINAMAPVAPTSYPGAADVATIMAGLAKTMGLAFENNGVQVKLASPYFAGTALEQAHNVARAAGIEMYIDSGSNTLSIWPKLGTRAGPVPLISPASGLIGYPDFRDFYLTFRTILNPAIKIGGQINMQSTAGGAAAPTTGATQRKRKRPALTASGTSPRR